MCREERQLAVGAVIAGLAAGTGGAYVAGSTSASILLGSIAGGALGLDFATFNSAKSAAFGTATAQADCIFRSTTPAIRELKDIEATYEAFDVSDGCMDPSRDSDLITTTSARAAKSLYTAEKYVGWQQAKFVVAELARSGLNTFQAVESSQVGAFAASQSGIVSPSQISQGIAAMSFNLPGATVPSNLNLSEVLKKPDCEEEFKQAELESLVFRSSLAAFQLPDPQVQACLSLSAGGGGAPASSSSSKGGGAPSGGGGPSGAPSGGGSPSGGGGSALAVAVASNTLLLDNSKGDACGTVQVSGGTPPYYWVSVDDPSGVRVTSPEIRLAVDSKQGGRVLIADQGGSQQILNVIPMPIPGKNGPTPSATPTPTACAPLPPSP